MNDKTTIKIIGAKGQIDNVDTFLTNLSNYALKNKVGIQVFDADMVYGTLHLRSAFEHAKRAIKQKSSTTNSLEMELLLYTSGERQLKLAIPKVGIKKGNVHIAFLFFSKKSNIDPRVINKIISINKFHIDNSVLQGDIQTLRNFGIRENEIKTVTKAKYEDLILEKVAMVDVIK
jgi:tRNA threonylcarbamoyladenosine modification (KEOPS) complex Cgi121 subunit